jgi:hypothetical protein
MIGARIMSDFVEILSRRAHVIFRNTKLSNVTNAHSSRNLTNLAIKKAMTAQTTSFGFVVIADDRPH